MAWIGESLTKPTPDYGIQYTIPVASTQPADANAPATQQQGVPGAAAPSGPAPGNVSAPGASGDGFMPIPGATGQPGNPGGATGGAAQPAGASIPPRQ